MCNSCAGQSTENCGKALVKKKYLDVYHKYASVTNNIYN